MAKLQEGCERQGGTLLRPSLCFFQQRDRNASFPCYIITENHRRHSSNAFQPIHEKPRVFYLSLTSTAASMTRTKAGGMRSFPR